MWWKILILATCWNIGVVLVMLFLQIRDWKEKRKAKREFLEWGKNAQVHQQEYCLELGLRADMDILSRRITNAFDYIGDLRSEYKAHEARFHTPKKSAGKPRVKK